MSIFSKIRAAKREFKRAQHQQSDFKKSTNPKKKKRLIKGSFFKSAPGAFTR